MFGLKYDPNRLKAKLEAKVKDGNPAGVPLFESLDDLASWVDYEAEVVDEAADELSDPDTKKAAQDQADAMHEASDELEEASDEAKEAAAKTFADTGTPSSQQEAEHVAGNPGEITDSNKIASASASSSESANDIVQGNPETTEQGPHAPARRQAAGESTPQGTGTTGTRTGQEGAIVGGNPTIETGEIHEELAEETRDEPPGSQHWLFRPFKQAFE